MERVHFAEPTRLKRWTATKISSGNLRNHPERLMRFRPDDAAVGQHRETIKG